MTRLSFDLRTRAYMERRTKEGRSKREVIRILKRYVARRSSKPSLAPNDLRAVGLAQRIPAAMSWPWSDLPARRSVHFIDTWPDKSLPSNP